MVYLTECYYDKSGRLNIVFGSDGQRDIYLYSVLWRKMYLPATILSTFLLFSREYLIAVPAEVNTGANPRKLDVTWEHAITTFRQCATPCCQAIHFFLTITNVLHIALSGAVHITLQGLCASPKVYVVSFQPRIYSLCLRSAMPSILTGDAAE
jgi:hypothetical protein